MPRIKLTIQYKGTNYCGWQVQPNGVTIQELLQKTLHRLFQKKINVIGSGRTDSGVHALGQVCHFDADDVGAYCNTPLHKIIYSLNSLLPTDIAVIDAQIVDEKFHAQKSAKRKTYEYFILNSRTRSPFLNEYVWQIPVPLDLKKMRQAARCLVGEHDFKAFCASDSSVKTTVRRVYRISIRVGAYGCTPLQTADSLIGISIVGNGFLKQMVRNIVGTLVQVGKGRMRLAEFRKAFKSRDRRQAGATAPARGLVLRRVIY
ncbi:MAG: tRNA pseudouridine(38-40) synthase TruA [Deltaproteobacteria bacterium]|nr:tRNA pseudouridine(38-40) synthase TruA [Deltaproteobacteria bacterium]